MGNSLLGETNFNDCCEMNFIVSKNSLFFSSTISYQKKVFNNRTFQKPKLLQLAIKTKIVSI